MVGTPKTDNVVSEFRGDKFSTSAIHHGMVDGEVAIQMVVLNKIFFSPALGRIWRSGPRSCGITKDMPTAIMIEVDDYDGPKFPGTSYIPIFPVTRRFEYKKHDCSRTNFPLRPAYTITVHKALSLKQVVLNLERKDHVPGLPYIAISRVKRLSSIIFETPFDLSRFVTKESSNMKDKARDWDLRTLQGL
ncbi:hypothetical protein DL95DRAFT_418572 [Leptodontidium sp. 2 PMI_412]|nr:hypothetical protein DL95DRAFT_418572 [Leptodontidium sp. 2 PMI_412]